MAGTPVRSVSQRMNPATRQFLQQTEAKKGCFVRTLALAPTLALVAAVSTAVLLCGLMFFAHPTPKFIQNRANGACLSALGNEEIKAVPCADTEEQHWWFVMVGGGDAHMLVSEKNTTSCLQIPQDVYQTPQILSAGECNGNKGTNQNWGFSKDAVPKGTITLQNPSPGDDWDYDKLNASWCFQIPEGATASTAATYVEVAECDLEGLKESQLWEVTTGFNSLSLMREAATAHVVRRV